MKKRFASFQPFAMAATLSIGLAALTLRWLYLEYLNGSFRFHDLTLLTDALANTIWRQKTLWVSDYSINHLTVHFTPSLLFFAPLFGIFESQFVFVVMGVASTLGALLIALKIAEVTFRKGNISSETTLRIILIGFALLLGANHYIENIQLSAHFEPLSLFPIMLLFFGLITGKGPLWLGLCLVVALGFRQDVGVFLCFQLLALAMCPVY